jgi:hypothetical protein
MCYYAAASQWDKAFGESDIDARPRGANKMDLAWWGIERPYWGCAIIRFWQLTKQEIDE